MELFLALVLLFLLTCYLVGEYKYTVKRQKMLDELDKLRKRLPDGYLVPEPVRRKMQK